MKKYEIEVNGKVYQVSVKELTENERIEENKQVKENTDQNIKTSQRTEDTPQKKASNNAEMVTAPMPGNILRVLVNENENVSAGTTLCVLEAMKMENEIVAPKDGVVTKIAVENNQAVEAGEALVWIS